AAARQFKDLVNAGGPQTTVTLRLEWSALGARVTLKFDPATLFAERSKVLAPRVGPSTEAKNARNPDQDFTLQGATAPPTAAIPASAVHRLLYPDVAFGAGKIVMQTLRLQLTRLADLGLELTDLRSIALVFDRRATGVVYVGDVQVSN